MAATDKAVMAVIRISKPSFRNDSDKLAFTVHASFLVSGYVLMATGRSALSNSVLSTSSSGNDEVGIENWNELEDEYGFVYLSPEKNSKKVLVKCLVINDNFMIDALCDDSADPIHAKFLIKDYVGESTGTDYASQFKNFDKLVLRLKSEIISKLDGSSTESSISSSSTQTTEPIPIQGMYMPVDAPILQPYPAFFPYPAGNLGSGDLLPGPCAGVYPAFRNPYGGGGSMLLGPDDPGWFGGSVRPGFPTLPPGVAPGARFDPYGPPGIPGFERNRFGRNRGGWPGNGGTHPDLEHFGGSHDFI